MNKAIPISIAVLYLIIIAPVSFGLEISNVGSKAGPDYAIISWKTDEGATSKVSYGKEKGQLTQSESSLAEVTNHSIALGNLDKTTKYFFEIMSGGIINNNLGQYYTFQTQSSTQPPVLEVNVPAYANKDTIDISGKTQPFVKIDLYVNGIKVRKRDPKAEEEFSFSDVLIPAQVNTIKIDAADADGNTNSKTFTVTVDKKAPAVNLAEVPSAVIEGSIKVKGTVDENSTVTILVNGEQVFNQSALLFEQDISLNEGKNLLTIGVSDIAGNEVTITKTILYDSKPPTFESVDPKSGSFFYEGSAVTDIKGITEPGARVELYYNKEPDGKPRRTATADENGRFEFKDFNVERGLSLEEILTGKGDLEVLEQPVTQPGAMVEKVETPVEYGKPEKVGVKINLVATDAVGQKGEAKLQYRIGTCYSGEMAFDIINLVEYQSPTILSPERLEQGTELIAFILNISYRSIGTNVKIQNVKIERACEATSMQTDEKYIYSCKIMSNTPNVKHSNEAKTTWYIRYDLAGLKDIDGFSQDVWKDLTNQMTFPLKVRIEYTADEPYDMPEEKGKRKFMTKCLPVAYALDTSKIDPRDLPDGLLSGAQGVVNGTLEALNKVIPWVTQVTRIAGIACFFTFAAKLILVISKRFTSYSEHFADKSMADTDPSKCPAPGRSPRKNGEPMPAGGIKLQDDYENKEFEVRCPDTFGMWKQEADFDKAMKWACDRFLCRAVPAGWTEKATLDDIRGEVEQSLLCGEQVTGTQGIILKELSSNECGKRGAPVGTVTCYEYNNEIYVFKERAAGSSDESILQRVKTGGVPRIGVQDKITVVQSGTSSQIKLDPTRSVICEKSCTSAKGTILSKWTKGGCLTADQASTKDGFIGNNYDFKVNKDYLVNCPKDTRCYCWNAKEKGKETKEAFDYRMNKVGLAEYNKYIYYEERDKPGCFGQDRGWVNRFDPMINPRSDIISAFQCGCTTQVRARLIALRNILFGFNRCLEQIRKTGEYNTGICKEIFTQYICKWASRIISYLMQGCAPFAGKPGEVTLTDNLQAFTSSIVGGAEEAASDLLSDYDSPGLRDYLGVGEGAIAEKVCLGALTGDWGFNIEGFMDAAYEAPFHTSVMVFPATREYLTWNPSTEQSTYEYRIGWMISAGCDIVSYDVFLGCITDYEYTSKDGIQCRKNPSTGDRYNSPTGCDCRGALAGEVKTMPSSGTKYHGGEIPQTGFEDKSVHISLDSLYRYDHAIVRLNLADSRMREQCFPEGSEDGLFFFPITDDTARDIAACRFDQSTGQFVCNAGKPLFNERGSAYFGKVECDDTVACEDKTYYLGDNIEMNKFEVWNLGPDKCMYWNVKNSGGQVIEQRIEDIPKSPTDEDYEKVFERGKSAAQQFVMVNGISSSHLLKVPPVVTVIPDGSRMAHENTKDGEVTPGKVSVWFVDTNKDRLGEQIIIGNKNAGAKEFTATDTFFINGAALRFSKPDVQQTKDKCGIYSCQEYVVNIEVPTLSRTATEILNQVWTLHFEIRAKPENGTGYCQDTTEKDVITSRGSKQTKDIKVKVSTKSKSETYRCEYLSGYVGNENRICDCDGSYKGEDLTQPTAVLPYKGVNDCDGETTRYCYAHTPSGDITQEKPYKCEKAPKCYPGTKKNSVACDCNLDGVAEEDCKNKYCYDDDDDKKCHDTAEVTKVAPVIDESKSLIGAFTLAQLKSNSNANSNPIPVTNNVIRIYASDDVTNTSKLTCKITVGDTSYNISYNSKSGLFELSQQIFKDLGAGTTPIDVIVTDTDSMETTQRYYVYIPHK